MLTENDTSGSAPWPRAGRIPSLDGLRAVAVALVLFAHVHQTAGLPRVRFFDVVGSHAAIGVEIFFVISGFLITTLMLRELGRENAVNISAFYQRRVLRIVPAYACLLVVIAIMNGSGFVHLRRADWLAALTYTVNFLPHPNWNIGHAWSLSIEEHFYLIWPLVLARGGIAFARRAALGAIAFCFVMRWAVLLFAPRHSAEAELWTFTRLDTIAFGCLLAVVACDPVWRQRLGRLCSSNRIVGLAGLGLVGSVFLSSFSAKFAVGVAYTANSALIALLLWSAVERSGSRVGRWLNHPAVAFVGVGSYSLYLWQQIFLNRGSHAFVCTFPQNLLFACVAAWVSYRFIERPFLSLKGRISAGRGAARSRGQAHPAAAQASPASP
ncbi:MAG TPA: acyltransferase [Tepidisphaeraceae bacterium]|jgi:peptidoglycan/LPS O-acetylase OafA/YrhL|nr:acyltransferase [Tepidisphaeraceae bacterium]